MKFSVLSLFPGYFKGPLDESILGRAVRRGLIEFSLVDIREYSTDDRHHRVDDRPYGGGPGMVLMAEPVAKALRTAKTPGCHTVYLSPQGKTLTAGKAQELARYEHLVLLCGHYEGIDERALSEVDEEISIGDYVLTNGCLAALVVADAVSRFLPQVLGHEEAAQEESFQSGLLDCPHYTRPEVFEGKTVPKVLLGGDHKEIAAWRHSRALEKTKKVRPDLFFLYEKTTMDTLSHDDAEGLNIPSVALTGLSLWVESLKESLAFYRYVLGLTLVDKQEKKAKLQGQGITLCLVEELQATPSPTISVMELTTASQAYFSTAQRRLKEKGIPHLGQQDRLEVADPNGHLWRIVLHEAAQNAANKPQQ